MIIAFITSKNSPRVKIVTGRVKIIKIGRTMRRSRATTMATIIAELKPATSTPGKT